MAAKSLRAAESSPASHLLFEGPQLILAGNLLSVAVAMKDHRSPAQGPETLVFEVSSGRQIDIDVRGSRATLAKRFAPEPENSPPVPQPTGRGRPRLGVVGREVTLLPRHWAWLERQRGGASATLRRLVDEARQAGASADRVRDAQDRTHRFMSVLAGDLAGYEEATRALFAADRARFMAETRRWPKDVRHYARAFAADAFAEQNG